MKIIIKYHLENKHILLSVSTGKFNCVIQKDQQILTSMNRLCVQKPRFPSRGDRGLGVAFQTHPGRQAFISSGSKEARSALESRRVSLGAHWVD